MKLGTYLSTKNISRSAFGDMIGRTQASVSRYVTGERFPDRETILKIEKATKGKVTVADWYAAPQRKSA